MTDASEWLISTAKRNPEALLVLGAGCALLMRGGSSSYRVAGRSTAGVYGYSEPWRSSVAGDVKDRVADTASSVTEQAGAMAKTLSEQTSQIAGQAQSVISNGFGQLLREQPLALVAAGLVAGAAVAALLPSTDLEERALGGARDAISGMTAKMGENLTTAATEAGQRLTQGVTERATQTFREVAQGAVGQFTEKVAGATEEPRGSSGDWSPVSSKLP